VQKRYKLLAALRAESGFGCECLALVQVHRDPLQLSRCYAPPPRNFRSENHLRYEIAPDQRLLARRYQEVLFSFSKRIGQARE
jgi:hypothetical protein